MNKVLSAGLLFFATLFVLAGPPGAGVAHAEPFVGEIRWVAFNFAPEGWALCDGQMLQIIDNQALFSLLGTTYGGDGRTTFALPDMRGRAPIHGGGSGSHSPGTTGGEENHTLSAGEIPAHTHSFTLNADPREGNSDSPAGTVPAKTSAGTPAYGAAATTTMSQNAVSAAGAGQPHENMKPFITMNCIIALQGIYPSVN